MIKDNTELAQIMKVLDDFNINEIGKTSHFARENDLLNHLN
jgi:hypothetical protein